MIAQKIKNIAKKISTKAEKPRKICPATQRWLSTEYGKDQEWAAYMFASGQHEALLRHGSKQDHLIRR
jgi:hypothetical protein